MFQSSDKVLFLTHGIPGSGKSTWARKHFPKERIVRTDDIRFSLWEEIVKQGRKIDIYAVRPITYELAKRRLRKILSDGFPAVVDACNTRRETILDWKEIADEFGYEICIVDFSDISLKICLERNYLRQGWAYVHLNMIFLHLKNLLTEDISDFQVIKPF